MKTSQDLLRLITSYILILIVVVAMPLTASAEDAESEVVFVDLDGDGFHDSAEDANNDGIPDARPPETDMSSETSVMHAATINPFGDMSQAAVVPARSSWKGSFGLRRIAALGLGASRCDFSAVTGDNDNLANGGLGGGGACAGGVCIRR